MRRIGFHSRQAATIARRLRAGKARRLGVAAALVACMSIAAPSALAEPLAASAVAAASDFVGGALPAPPALPYVAAQDFTAGHRLADVALALGVIVALFLFGLRLRRGPAPGVQPAVLTVIVVAVLMLTVVNPAFWQLAAVSATEDGLSVERYAAPDITLPWADVQAVAVTGGHAFPVFGDDRALRISGPDDVLVDIPRYLPGSDQLAAAVVAALGASKGSQEAAPDPAKPAP